MLTTNIALRALNTPRTSRMVLRSMSYSGYGNHGSEDPKKKQESANDQAPQTSDNRSTKSSVETPVASDSNGSSKLPKSTEDVSNSVRRNVAHED
ncbi:hypothetical protein K493DRAFT_312945 [Basidiobolus meristosporus CBS 931.73]|uniref:Uncharacterized protein n=1 Tax=Basidiobolus meristosporus CBS 931.73 TaxID=1314790 RepID=A0A1Y1YQP9_9FUNG|nr:hypothetical protein K493DRAFT_312945 [Basidiobolus meristosporus CBS 931.73]|eukprot:ORY00134.1 hypothetical protein K493DRAFT_312945 [Basidiobolus meristosporus CBS 931.73]